MAGIEASDSLLAGVDWLVIGYAAGMATLMSVLVTLRARNQQAFAGQPLPGWSTLIPDTLLGGVVGTIAALVLPEVFAALRTFAGVSLIAGVGGVIGPKLVDWVSARGVGVLLTWVGGMGGKLSEAVAAEQQRKDGGGDGGNDENSTGAQR